MNKTLTPEQSHIVSHVNGHAIVKAVPGSGKTTTLVMRVTRLMYQEKVPPNEILILMYNRAASVSFSEKLKLSSIKYNIYKTPEVRTFHSYAAEIVRKAESRGVIKRKELVKPDRPEYKSIIRNSYAHGFNPDNNYIDNEKIESLDLDISNWRRENVLPDDLEQDPNYEDVDAKTKKAYRKYFELMELHGLRTYDDLLIESVQLIREQKISAPALKHIVVDEYQDVNYIQNEFLKCLAQVNTNVMVVGDVNQCIYEWRGSRPDFIEGIFQRDFANSKLFYLSCTFRYGHSLSYIANELISKNKSASTNICVSHPSNHDTNIILHQGVLFSTVIRDILQSPNTKAIGVIGRSNADLIEPEITLRLLNIPCKVSSTKPTLIRRSEISLITVLFCLVSKGGVQKLASHEHFYQIIKNFIQQLNFRLLKGQLKVIIDAISKDKSNFFNIIDNSLSPNSLANRQVLGDIKELINVYTENVSIGSVYAQIEHLGLLNNVGATSVIRRETNDQQRGLVFMKRIISMFNVSISEFLNVLISPVHPKEDTVGFELTTMHGSKGLEWDKVIIVGLEDNLFPGSKNNAGSLLPLPLSDEAIDDIREERRLFYVAVTRALKELHLLAPKDPLLERWLRKGWSSTPKNNIEATRFLYELDFSRSSSFLEHFQPNKRNEIKNASYRTKQYYRALESLLT